MADWRKLFKSTPNQTLEYFPPVIRNGPPIVTPPKEVYSEGANEWKSSLVAQFLGKPPSFNLIQRILTKLWEKKGTVKVISAGFNLFIFQFDCDAVCNWVLENGPWHVQSNTMVLRKWMPNMGRLDLDLQKIPLWFHLHHVPLDLYNQNGISHLASAIGIPLYMDKITAERNRLSYARVCIEVAADIVPPEIVEYEQEDGTLSSIGVSIPWKPLICNLRKVFGHSDSSCTKKIAPKQVWVAKKVESSDKAPQVFDANDPPGTSAPQVFEENVPTNENHPDCGKFDDAPLDAEQVPKINMNPKLDGFESPRINSNKKKDKWSSPVKISITSSSNKYAALLEDAATVEDDPSDEAEVIEEDVPVFENPSITQWKSLIDNAKFTPCEQREAAKGQHRVLMELKGNKNKILARGAKKVQGSSPLGEDVNVKHPKYGLYIRMA